MNDSTYLNVSAHIYAHLGCQPFSPRVTDGLPITVWGHSFEKVRVVASNLSASTSSSRQRAHLRCGALGRYLRDSIAIGPFGSHFTPVMPLVA